MRYIFSAPGTSIPDVHVLRGATGPKIESGYGRWDTVERPKRKSATIYAGLNPIGLAIPILLDGWVADDPVQRDVNNLLRMSQEIGGEPPAVRVNAGISGGLPVDVGGIDFIMSNIEWGDNQLWDFNNGGVLVLYRQDAIVHVLERVDIKTLALHAKSRGNSRGSGGSGSKKPSTYVVKAGDTLTSIAVHVLKDRSRWREIAKLNKISDPRNLKVGQVLRMPK